MDPRREEIGAGPSEQFAGPEQQSDKLDRDRLDTSSDETTDEEFDASEYVRQLIARMGPGVPPQTIDVPRQPAPTKPDAPSKAKSSPVRAPLPLGDAPASLDELKQESTDKDRASNGIWDRKRSLNVDLAKLREAANITTSSVLHAFDCKWLVRQAYCELSVAVVSMGTSLMLLAMCNRVKSFAFGASVVMLILAGTATYRYSRTTKTLGDKLRAER